MDTDEVVLEVSFNHEAAVSFRDILLLIDHENASPPQIEFIEYCITKINNVCGKETMQ